MGTGGTFDIDPNLTGTGKFHIGADGRFQVSGDCCGPENCCGPPQLAAIVTIDGTCVAPICQAAGPYEWAGCGFGVVPPWLFRLRYRLFGAPAPFDLYLLEVYERIAGTARMRLWAMDFGGTDRLLYEADGQVLECDDGRQFRGSYVLAGQAVWADCVLCDATVTLG